MSHKFLSLKQAVIVIMESNDEKEHNIVLLPLAKDAEDLEVDNIDKNDLCSKDIADIVDNWNLIVVIFS